MIYWYHPPDYWKYLEFTERINLDMSKRFREEGIVFALPELAVFTAEEQIRGKPLDANNNVE